MSAEKPDLASRFRPTATPIADDRAIVPADRARFTVLTDRLIRCEFDPDGQFEDRPSQHFWHRRQPVPEFSVESNDDETLIRTGALELCYRPGPGGFSAESLRIRFLESDIEWHFGQVDPQPLPGTARTLDACEGAMHVPSNRELELTGSLVSRSGWALVDDSATLVFRESGLLEPRGRSADARDVYFFGHGRDYAGCLADYYAVAGHVPLLPKWALGLWWSRWQKYTQADLEALADDFAARDIPLSVCVVDMDWHIVDNPHTSGWTGFTWNREFFPDPGGFFERMHRQGVRACMNLHPADGVHPHEDAYEDVARFMGIDPQSKRPVPFDPGDPRFIEAYFRYLLHPREAEGVDFWWMDWQQGKTSKIPGLDPLWLLNHLHAQDRARDGAKRPFVFSRWGGVGNHRYPVGFSGDTYSCWETLRYEVHFTASAANTGYGWWSHDIGGFARGEPDDELYARWVQFGCWAPILRMHNSGDPTIDYRPWTKPSPSAGAATRALQMRRRLEPYLYTSAWRNSLGEPPLVTPMYYRWGDADEAYICPEQYAFGPDLVVAPHTRPMDPRVGESRQVVCLPEGEWVELETGLRREGGRWHASYGDLDHVPVFARAGSILPLRGQGEEDLELIAFAGADGTSRVYDDDGETMDFARGQFEVLALEQTWDGRELRIDVRHDEGKLHKPRRVTIRIRGLGTNEVSRLLVNGQEQPPPHASWDDGDLVLSNLTCEESLQVSTTLRHPPSPRRTCAREVLTQAIHRFRMNAHGARRLLERTDEICADVRTLGAFLVELTEPQIRALVERIADVGFDHVRLPDGRDRFCWWNPNKNPHLRALVSHRKELAYERHVVDAGDSGGSLVVACKDRWADWRAHVNYLDLATLHFRRNPEPESV
jgi:alpha-glucosidase (family GH31 glycosyl hydrolase)